MSETRHKEREAEAEGKGEREMKEERYETGSPPHHLASLIALDRIVKYSSNLGS